MKDIEILDIEKKEKRNINKKKLIITISIGIIILAIGITMLIYYSSRDARNFLDQYLFRKNVSQEKLDTIALDYDSNISVIAYNRNLCVLAENKLMKYNSSGNLESEIDIEISNPVYSVNNKYLAISEQNGSNLYLISGDKILWTNEVDGNINKINVNESGYVSVIITGTTYKSVITTFNNEGKQLFNAYLDTTQVVDTSISKDNQYLAFAGVNTTGTTIKSTINVASIEQAEIIQTFSAEDNKLILNIEYQNNNNIICMYDSEISVINNNSSQVIMNLNESGKNINFANINLDNYIYRAIEENAGLFDTNTVLEMQNVTNNNMSVYTTEGAAKAMYSYNNIVAINLGQEIEFVNTSGWMLKRYFSSQEVQNVVIGNGIAGIVYQDRVEILNL